MYDRLTIYMMYVYVSCTQNTHTNITLYLLLYKKTNTMCAIPEDAPTNGPSRSTLIYINGARNDGELYNINKWKFIQNKSLNGAVYFRGDDAG